MDHSRYEQSTPICPPLLTYITFSPPLEYWPPTPEEIHAQRHAQPPVSVDLIIILDVFHADPLYSVLTSLLLRIQEALRWMSSPKGMSLSLTAHWVIIIDFL